jgi:N-acetylglutamate synthase-like GNAT family acetyltransferase
MTIKKERTIDGFLFSTEKYRLDIPYIHRFLSKQSYWAQGVPLKIVEQSVNNALCFGVYYVGDGGTQQIGFARLITDLATFGYLADVFIDEDWRKKGLSKKLMAFIFDIDELKFFRRMILATLDAHGLYAKFGFTPLKSPDRFMEKAQPDIYKLLIE